MPTYEYRCPNGHDFEIFFRSISSAEAETAVVCPVCSAVAVRQLSSAGLQFKGSGFYLTDYGKNAHGKKAPPAATSSGDGSSSGGSTESSSSSSPTTGSTESGSSSDSTTSKDPGKKADKPAPTSSAANKPSSGTKNE